MLNVSSKIKDMVHLTFLSNEHHLLKKKAKKLGIKKATYGWANKEQLRKILAKMNFGFVLREPSPVNFVACPTKIYDYLICGVIPIVRTPNIGDFSEFGYKYVKEEDLLNKKLPTKLEQKEMILENFEVAKRMQNCFAQGVKELRTIIQKETLSEEVK